MRKKSLPDALNHFPKADMWLLFIDGHRLDEGPLAFDSDNKFSGLPGEPGYVHGMTEAWNTAMSRLDEEINLNLIARIHDISISSVPNMEDNLGYRTNSSAYGLFMYTSKENFHEATLSREGLQELVVDLDHINSSRLNNKNFPANIILYANKSGELISDKSYFVYLNEHECELGKQKSVSGLLRPVDAEHILLKHLHIMLEHNDLRIGNFTLSSTGANKDEVLLWIRDDLNTYFHDVTSARKSKDPDLIIRPIVKFIRRCLQGHYFYDGNGRTFAPIMLNFLLLQNGLSPALLMSPNHFSGFSLDELVKEVKDGMLIFRDFCSESLNTHLGQIRLKDITSSPEKIKMGITNNLSRHPLARLAQLNDIYQKIESDECRIGRKLIPAWAKSEYKPKLLQILQDTYLEEVKLIRDKILQSEQDGSRAPMRSVKELDELTSRHVIYANADALQKASSNEFQQSKRVSQGEKL